MPIMVALGQMILVHEWS